MRGFPLLNVLVVVVFLAATWWPLQHLTGKATASADAVAAGGVNARAGENFTILVVSSHPLDTLSVTHLGQTLLSVADPEADSEIAQMIAGVEIPDEGIEFWVEARLADPAEGAQRPAIQLELIPENLEREPRRVTLWGQPGDSEIEGPAAFLWPGKSN